jgi:hypothetical protein
MPVTKQIEILLSSVQKFSAAYGIPVVKGVDENSKLFIAWVPYLNNLKTGTANELLDGAVSSLREAAACAALGLIRPSLLAMRTEIDLIFGWLYFKDHPVEWEYVNSKSDGFKLKKEILDYLLKYYESFGARFGTLKDIKTRVEQDPYRLLSAHIHSQSLNTIPLVDILADVVDPKNVAMEIVKISYEVDEFVSDILFAVYGENWTQLPKSLLVSLDSRFKTPNQKKVFFNP